MAQAPWGFRKFGKLRVPRFLFLVSKSLPIMSFLSMVVIDVNQSLFRSEGAGISDFIRHSSFVFRPSSFAAPAALLSVIHYLLSIICAGAPPLRHSGAYNILLPFPATTTTYCVFLVDLAGRYGIILSCFAPPYHSGLANFSP